MYAYLSKKLEMPAGATVKCVSWSGEEGYLAAGCENGLLKVLKIENSKSKDEEKSPPPRGFLSAPTNISMNQNLDGHSSNVQVIAWNRIHQKLTTSDSKGLIIVWMLYKGTWYEEMVNNRNKSTVKGLAWSHDGSKICIVYEDGGIIVGSSDGNRLWGRDLKGPQLTGVSWSPEAKQILFTFNSGEIHIYDLNGIYMSKLFVEKVSSQNSEDEAFDPIVNARWQNSKLQSDQNPLVVIWRNACLHLFKTTGDENPLRVETNLITLCGDASPNGDYIAIGGRELRGVDEKTDQVKIFSWEGKFLQVVKIPAANSMSLSWDCWSLRLAIGSGSHIYFANLRPRYKYTMYGDGIFAYCVPKNFTATHVTFFDQNKHTTQEIAGKLLELKGKYEHCAALTKVKDSHLVTIFDGVGATVNTLQVLTLRPFSIAVTNTCLVCLASNAVLIWRFKVITTHLMKREKMFHIDESQTPMNETNNVDNIKEPVDLSKGTRDPIVCGDAVNHLLAIGRESGKILVFSLPHGSIITTISVPLEMGGILEEMSVKNDGKDVAVIDSFGRLYTGSLETMRIGPPERKDVWNLCWSKDSSGLLAFMEKTRMYVMKGGEVEEPEITSAYIAGFKDLRVTMVLMDELMQNPESPSPNHFFTLETRSLRDTRALIENGAPLRSVIEFVEMNSHDTLWKILAQAALEAKDYGVVETSFVRCLEYPGILLAKKISNTPNENVRRGEILAFFGQFQEAEEAYIEADRKDLASEMWRLLGDWKKVEVLSQVMITQKPSDRIMREVNKSMGDFHAESQNWAKAAHYYEKADDEERLVEVYTFLEDYARLEKLAGTLMDRNPLLIIIGDIFASVGLAPQAVKAYLAGGNKEKAVEASIKLHHWHLALEVGRKEALVTPVLVRYGKGDGDMKDFVDITDPMSLYRITRHLLEKGDVFKAVELFVKSGNPRPAAQILGMLGIHELEKRKCRPVVAKKLFVMSAMLFEEKKKKKEEDSLFESHIPAYYRPSPIVLNWMEEKPWRGAEAAHFFILQQRALHLGKFVRASKAALHLLQYKDLLGYERINAVLVLAAVHANLFGIASLGLMSLEGLGEGHEKISAGIFRDRFPRDVLPMKTTCPKCATIVPEGTLTCQSCSFVLSLCLRKGTPIHNIRLPWSCSKCCRYVDPTVMDRVLINNCPLCKHPVIRAQPQSQFKK